MLKKIVLVTSFLFLFLLFLFASPADYTADGNMVAYYYFEDSPGFDQSGTGDNHVDDAASDPAQDEADYKQGAQSADFEEDSSQYFQCSNASLTGDFPGIAASDSFSVVAWLKPESTPSTRHNIAGVLDGAGDASWRFQRGNNDRLNAKVFYSDSGSGDVDVPGNTVLSNGTWYHVALVVDGTANLAYVYRNGVEDASGGVAFDHTLEVGVNNFLIGREGAGGTRYMDGRIDELAVFDRALSSAEITEIMNDRLDGSEAAAAEENAIFFGMNFIVACVLVSLLRRKV